MHKERSAFPQSGAFRLHNKRPHSGGKPIYNNISRTRAPAGLGTSHSSSEGRCQLLGSEYWAEVLWINTGIIAIPLFKVDIPSSSECVGFGSKLSGTETNDEVESRKVFGPSCLSTREDFGH